MKSVRNLEEQIWQLERVIELTFWQARRYGNLRMTYAPSMIREAWKIIRAHPEWDLPQTRKYDDVVARPSNFELSESRKEDSLADCMNPEQA